MKVAVVGSGVSGLGATWLLNEHGSNHEVHLFDSDSRPGGHANTIRFFRKGDGQKPEDGVDVDTGFIVFNPTTYPNFLRFLQLPRPSSKPSASLDKSQIFPGTYNIDIAPTEMTFSVSRTFGNGKRRFEWAGDNLSTIFTQRERLLDPGMWRLMWDVLRFNACARRVLYDEDMHISVGEYLKREGYSDRFRDDYLLPMTAAIWSTPPEECAVDFPIRTLVQFMKNHHLLQITGKPKWLTIPGGSHKYVNSIVSLLPPEQLHLSTPVTAIRSLSPTPSVDEKHTEPIPVEVTYRKPSGEEVSERFDHVILACHSDTALQILRSGGDVTAEEEEILGRFQWSKNECVLHYDEKLMPRSRRAWSCWNYLTFSQNAYDKANTDGISLTYGMNHLQHIGLKKYGPVLVTLNPPKHLPIDENKTLGKWKYEHPVLDSKAVQSQAELHKIQGKRGISFAGAYTKYGFHEDGFTSGLVAAAHLLPDSTQHPNHNATSTNEDTYDTEAHLAHLNARKSQYLPFPILPPYEDSTSFDVSRDWKMMVLIGMFELMEKSGLRKWAGWSGTFWLAVVRFWAEIMLGVKWEF